MSTQIEELRASVDDMVEAAERIESRLRISRIIQVVLGVVATLALLLSVAMVIVSISVIGLVDDFREASIDGCHRGNQLRDDIVDLSTKDYTSFSIALQRLTGATQEERDELLKLFEEERTIPSSFFPVDCEAAY